MKVSHVSKQTYFNYQKREDFDLKNLDLINQIEKIYYESNGYYGYRRISDELRNVGYRVNHKKVQRLMNKLNLKPDPYSSFQGQGDTIVENLLERHFSASKPNEKWTSDITEFNC